MTNQEAIDLLKEIHSANQSIMLSSDNENIQHYRLQDCKALVMAIEALETVESLQAELDQWKRDAIADKAKLGEYKKLEEQGLLVIANNGDCGNCGLLSEFGGCSAFGYGKDTSEQCKVKFKELEGGVSDEIQ